MSGKTTWQIDTAHSDAEFAVKHLMISTVKGHFGDVTGTVVVDEAVPANSKADVTIAVASIDTRDEKRDAHLRSADFFDVEHFPTLTFKSKRVDGALGGDFKLVGDLTIRGVTREVTLNVESAGTAKDPWGGERSAYSATTKINRKDFGLTWNVALETGGVLVGDEVKISLDVQLVKQAAEATVGATA
ncbi:MAG: YceI family protein [Gemmatimonadota bacterium]|nr:YceI family protein [Gemmatimonadota bacterium]HEU4989307.1 YceI family protein [Gemmatimonadaceae bacterium]